MNKLKKCGISAISLIIATALFLLPCNVRVYAAETDKNFWAMWWLEQKTGVDWSKYTGMDAGLTYGEYVYRQTGRTVDYAVDTVCNGVSYDKTKAFVYNTVEDTRQTAKDMYNNMPGYPGVVQDFMNEKVWRVDGNGNVNVSGSDFWNSVYNDLFGDSGSTRDVYENVDNGYSVPSLNLNIQYVGLCDPYYGASVVDYSTVSPYITRASGGTRFINRYRNITGTGSNTVALGVTVNGYCIFVDSGYYIGGGISSITAEDNYIGIHAYGILPNGTNTREFWLTLNVQVSNNDINQDTVPVLQPSQVGFAIDPYTGIKYPIYTPYNPQAENPAPPDDLPYTINPDGTVTWRNPNPDPEHPENDTQDTDIWINPNELTDDGWFLLLKWLTDNGYGTGDGGGYNGDGKPYNLDSLGDNATLLDVIKAGFKDLLNKLNPFGNLIDTIKNALKSFFNIDFSVITSFEIDIDFDILTTIYEKLLQMLGVS